MAEGTTHGHMPAKPARGRKWEPRFHPGVFVGMLNSSSEALVVTEQGTAIKTLPANIRRIPESEGWNADRILGMRAVPWSLDGSDNAFDIQVGMERPTEMVPRAPTFAEQTSNNCEVCRGCRYLRTGWGRQQARIEACRRRIEALLKGDPVRTIGRGRRKNQSCAG